MGIVFFCQSCGARFEVDRRMAGKKGHCKKCGQVMSIPRAEQIASMTAIPAIAGARAGSAASGGSIGSALRANLSEIKLDPLSIDRMPAVSRARKPSAPTAMSVLDDAEDSKPYNLAIPLPKSSGRVSAGAANGLALWRGQIGKLQRVLRSLNETSYLLSVPFIVLFLIGVAVKSRSTALFGATFLVMLAVAGIVSGVANLLTVPLRDGFNGEKMKKPIRRIAEPLGAILVVVAAFAFIPWLSTGRPPKGGVGEKLKATAQDLRREMKGTVRKAAGGAEEKLKEIGDGAEEKLKKIREASKERSE